MSYDDDYVEQATTFDAGDVPDKPRFDGSETKREQYNRLSVANRPGQVGKWRDQSRSAAQSRRAVVEAVASTLELTPHQKALAKQYFDAAATERVSAYKIETVAVCVCGLAGREDGRNYHPNVLNSDGPPQDSEKAAFWELLDDIGVSHSEFYSCWEKVRRDIL